MKPIIIAVALLALAACGPVVSARNNNIIGERSWNTTVVWSKTSGHGAYVFTDPETGCQYLQQSMELTPRLGRDGKPMGCGSN